MKGIFWLRWTRRNAPTRVPTDPARPGSLDRNELARGVRTYHLSCGRHPVQAKCWLPGRQECCQQGHTATIGRLLVMLSLRTPTQN